MGDGGTLTVSTRPPGAEVPSPRRATAAPYAEDSWWHRARCHPRVAGVFDDAPTVQRNRTAALQICDGCPVQRECERYVRTLDAFTGIAAGHRWIDGRPVSAVEAD